MTDVKRVLIYHLGSLGDTLIALPALHLIAHAFPNSERRMPTNSRERQGSSYRLFGTPAVRCILLRLFRRRAWRSPQRATSRGSDFFYGTQHRVLYHKTEYWGCGLETCIVEKKRCLTSIRVDEVLAEVRAIPGMTRSCHQ